MPIRPSLAGSVARAFLVALALVTLAAGCRPGEGSGGSTGGSARADDGARGQAAEKVLRRVHLVAVGDVMLDRGVGGAIRKRGAESILACVREQLRAGDITWANLECPLSTRGAHAPKDCVFRADPSTVKVLQDGGFDVVSIANNHTLNSGRRTFLDTMDILDRNGILYCGGRRDPETAWWPVYVQVGGLCVGFMAYTDLSFAHGSDNKVAQDLSNLTERVREADAKCDLLVVSLHWGEEYRQLPTQRQRQVARATADAGADLILGHHPHVLEGIAAYRGVPILYSMGNFVFDQKAGERMESAVFDIEYVDLWGWDVTATPVVVPRTRFGPEYPSAEKAEAVAKRLQALSAKLGSYPEIGDDNRVRLHVSGQDHSQMSETQPRSDGS